MDLNLRSSVRTDQLREKFRYGTLLLFWPIFGLLFLYLERMREVPDYYEMHCALDDFIPFNEWFIIPYMFWFVYLIGMISYTFFKEKDVFVQLMKYLIATNMAAVVIFFVFPTVQNLRPDVFPRDNVLTRFIGAFYRFDTDTNVCPSLHVVDSLAVLSAALRSRRFGQSRPWRFAFRVACMLICISTVFLKQHSAIDLVVGAFVGAIAEHMVYGSAAAQQHTARV